MRLQSPQAIKLQQVITTMLMEGRDLKIHNNEVNLTWLSHFIGITRQSFYPGRGPIELREIVKILNENITQLIPRTMKRPAHENIKVSVALHKALAEKEQLTRELLKQQKRWNDLYNERIVVG
ncbi:hypothetical protein [Pseudomonas sp. HTZ1]|uniref:hypothetical protein n=1 Tax=Pseudomonas sp. HTZ1 TaxID=3075219 RepID=UPI00287BEE3D|nr:hypothetical protein [Pseudomonas sp. HTZ1]MDS9589750.1 hypothetical protein [Pseudomonas sp. HTZ1]